MTNLKSVPETAEKFNNSIEELKNELRRVQSIKCRLKKQKAREDYDSEMLKVVGYEQLLLEAKQYLEPKGLPVTAFTQKEIELLNYEETIKAIKSIQSKKCNSQYLTNDINTNETYQEAVKIELLLLEHKKTQKPIEDCVVRKSDIQNLIENIENLQKISKEHILELLNNLL